MASDDDDKKAGDEGTDASSEETERDDAVERDEADGDEADGDDADESEGSDGASEPPAKSASEPPAKPAQAAKAKKPEPEPEDVVPERMRRARPKIPVAVAGPAPATSLGKSVTLFGVVVFGLGAGFYFLGKSEAGGDRNVPKWKIGQEVQVDITLDPRDDQKLACASPTEIGGKRCEFTNKTDKAPGLTDATMLKPYTTTDGVQFLAAGVWSHPELERGKRPAERFTVRCKLKVEGVVKSPAVRWDVGASWGERPADWHAGLASGCTLVK